MDGLILFKKFQVTFWTFWEELTVEDRIVLKAHILSFSAGNANLFFHLIHEGHLGLAKCKLRMKDTVYWPKLE